MIKKLIILPLFFLFFIQGYAQLFNFKSFSVQDGLVQSEVTCITQDKIGYLWIGTSGGLSRFDGSNFKNYGLKEGLPDTRITSILSDSKGNIWVGTLKNGICKIINSKVVEIPEEQKLSGKSIIKIIERNKEEIIVLTSEAISFIKDGQIKTYKFTLTKSSDNLNSLIVRNTGKIVVGTISGQLYEFAGNGFKSISDISLPASYCLFENKNGVIYSGTFSGPINTETGEYSLKNYKAQDNQLWVKSIYADSRGNTWYIINSVGIIRVSTDGNSILFNKKNGLCSNNINCIYEDKEKNIWLGTYGQGLCSFQGETFVKYETQSGFRDINIIHVGEDQNNNIIASTLEHGLYKFSNGNINDVTQLIPTTYGTYWNGIWTESNILYMATNTGFFVVNATNGKVLDRIPNDVFYQVYKDGSTYWLASANGIYKYTRDEGVVEKYLKGEQFNDAEARILFKDLYNRIWVGTFGGGVFYKEGDEFKKLKIPGLENAFITAILQDKNNNLWIATNGNGLVKYNLNNKIPIVITMDDGLVNNNIKSLLLDQNKLWIGTSNGFMMLNVDEFESQGTLNLRYYGQNEGFEGIECNRSAVIKDVEGNIWWGTVNGLIKHNPSKEKFNRISPKININSIEVFYNSTGWETYYTTSDSLTGLPLDLKLPYNQNHLTFNFSAISFFQPEKIKYSYELEGLGQGWSKKSSISSVTFSSLSPGDYTFRVKAINSTGIWSAEPAEFSFTISPPFWQTAWFYGACVIIVITIVYIIIFIRTVNHRKEKFRLEKLILKRTAEILDQKEKLEKQNKEKEVLLKEVHHRVKNNLQIITSLINLQSSQIEDPKIQIALKDTQNRVRSMALVHQKLYKTEDFSEIKVKEYILELIDTIRFSLNEELRGQEFDVFVDEKVNFNIETVIPVGLILNELITNCLKYANSTGKASNAVLSIKKTEVDKEYILYCKDNGPGFPENFNPEESASLGFQLIFALTEQINGEIKFYNEDGAVVEIKFKTLE